MIDREEVKRRLRLAAERTPHGTGPAPRYDDLYFKGAAWLDSLANPSTQIEQSAETAAQQGTVDPGATPTTR